MSAPGPLGAASYRASLRAISYHRPIALAQVNYQGDTTMNPHRIYRLTRISLATLSCLGFGVAAAAAATITVAGQGIPRLAPPPEHIDNQVGIDALFAPFAGGAVVDFRTPEAA